MRNVYLFLAASLGCLLLAAVSLASPEAIEATLFPNAKAVKVAQCSRLLQSYHHGNRTMPKYGTPERNRYEDCYYLICGGSRLGV
ncbi:hypothetical protein HB777_06530 [Mesorhizobium loti]|nr:hypothetical protein HB777_06530 [Mesorhizobium loti]